MRIIGPDDAPPRRSPAGFGQRVRVLATRAPGLAVRPGMVEVDVAPGATFPWHDHGDAEALVYVVAGSARFRAGGRSELVVGGALVYLPSGAEAAIANPGADTLRLLVVLTPGGYERRFLDWEPAHAWGAGAVAWPHAVLDLTGLPRDERPAAVVGALEAVRSGTALVVVVDHEPSGLRRELERRYGSELRWEPRERVGDRVAVAIWLAEPGGRAAVAGDEAEATVEGLFPTAA